MTGVGSYGFFGERKSIPRVNYPDEIVVDYPFDSNQANQFIGAANYILTAGGALGDAVGGANGKLCVVGGNGVTISSDGEYIAFYTLQDKSGLIFQRVATQDPNNSNNPLYTYEYIENFVADGENGAKLQHTGNSVALHTYDDNIGILVSDPESNDSGENNAGLVYFKRRINVNTFIEQTIFSPAPSEKLHFGLAFTISDDNTLLVITESDNQNDTGYLHIYDWNNISETWDFNHSISTTIDISDNDISWAWSIDISTDNKVISVGSTFYSEQGNRNIGQVTMFYNTSGTTWTEQQISNPSPVDDDLFGWSVSLVGTIDNYTLAIGKPQPVYSSGEYGSVYLYKYNSSGTSWDLITKLDGAEPGNTLNTQFGINISLSDDADVLVVGAPLFDASGTVTSPGAVYIYKKITGVWISKRFDPVFDPNDPNDYMLGTCVDITSDGEHVIYSAPERDVESTDSGQIYIRSNF